MYGNEAPCSWGVGFSFQAPEGVGMQKALSPVPESRLGSQNKSQRTSPSRGREVARCLWPQNSRAPDFSPGPSPDLPILQTHAEEDTSLIRLPSPRPVIFLLSFLSTLATF